MLHQTSADSGKMVESSYPPAVGQVGVMAEVLAPWNDDTQLPSVC